MDKSIDRQIIARKMHVRSFHGKPAALVSDPFRENSNHLRKPGRGSKSSTF
jgi:hypothetical protein